MKIGIKQMWWLLLAALGSMIAPPAWAAVTGSVQPATVAIPLAQPSTITLVWTVTTSPSPAPSFTISSSSGQFTTPLGQPLGTVNTVISRSFSGIVGGAPATAVITETVAVSPEISVQAMKLNATSIYYQRTFTDGSLIGLITDTGISIGGSGSAQFGITRMALEFDDGAIVRVVPKDSHLSAVANLGYNGSGLFSGYWEIANPASTSGTPIFMQLQPVFQGLGGIGQAKFASPDLPTNLQGMYIARLRVTDPPTGFDPPVLYYYVGEPKAGSAFSFMPMIVMNPPNQAYLDSATQFVWQPVTGARVYKIEIYANPDTRSSSLPDLGGSPSDIDPQLVRSALSRPPMAGMLVAGSQTKTTLSPSTRAKLQKGGSYFWRIQAISRDGSTVGAAQMREFRIP
jgi:hypothetical protein